MIEELFYIEKSAYKDSFIHRLDARVKIVLAFALIIAMVAVPYSPVIFTIGAIFFAFFALLWGLSRLPVSIYLKRIAMVLPLRTYHHRVPDLFHEPVLFDIPCHSDPSVLLSTFILSPSNSRSSCSSNSSYVYRQSFSCHRRQNSRICLKVQDAWDSHRSSR